MHKETLSWTGTAEIELNGIEYLCSVDVDVELISWQERHEPGMSEPMGEALVMLSDWEAECGGKPVHDSGLRKELRSKLVQWVSDHEARIIQQAK